MLRKTLQPFRLLSSTRTLTTTPSLLKMAPARVEVGSVEDTLKDGTMCVIQLEERAKDGADEGDPSQERDSLPVERLPVQDPPRQGKSAPRTSFASPRRQHLSSRSQVGGKYYATSNKCTHYGAPLVKGVLTASGRLVWCVRVSLLSSRSAGRREVQELTTAYSHQSVARRML
jgi:hypothetical protein